MWIRAIAKFCILTLASAIDIFSQTAVSKVNAPTLLVDIDHRVTISLDGDWHTIVDPYGTGLYDFHQNLRKNGYFINQKQKHGDGPLEYSFEKSPTLRVPGDWNTQRESLFLYEGPVWYEKDFSYQKRLRTRTFFHVGAANYRS